MVTNTLKFLYLFHYQFSNPVKRLTLSHGYPWIISYLRIYVSTWRIMASHISQMHAIGDLAHMITGSRQLILIWVVHGRNYGHSISLGYNREAYVLVMVLIGLDVQQVQWSGKSKLCIWTDCLYVCWYSTCRTTNLNMEIQNPTKNYMF